MRSLCVILVAAGLVGCRSTMPEPIASPQATVMVERPAPQAAALAFSPPAARGQMLDLSRDDRQPVAFLGFEELTIQRTSVRTDDRFRGDGRYRGVDFERRVVSVTQRTRVR